MCYQLTYRSSSVIGLSQEDIIAIVIKSRRKNNRQNITGCLVYHIGYFIQILEGKKELVKKLYHTIEDDNRHDDVEILHEGSTTKRIFAEWTMSFADLNPPNRINDISKKDLEALLKENSPKVFTTKVFWYHIKELLSNKGFYVKNEDGLDSISKTI